MSRKKWFSTFTPMPKHPHNKIWWQKIIFIQCLKIRQFAQFFTNPCEMRRNTSITTMLSTKFVEYIFANWPAFCPPEKL
jgi:hypothetical protein